ncbi:carboxylating nicotinate-nucleotide diphosphorylase [Nostocoides jenkinsii]|uniref:Nicotinate-nucleotide pyrophosphorylase [carboxylating] n=1 Tax=Nostocoides jenkinsii Ben 74 TaxID=1193518 RepID=A0A077MFV3_9MICO|nr:carboxylating nicotinate-nucleotide diphosphorylase [Tetrasphaera jenkinsii]CCI54163.1 Nicotinate-nucleotide pyrophosphorylase (carboxylating) [Tetrasphaera jenkinsii Ben 74]
MTDASDLDFPWDDARRVVRQALVEDLGGLDGVDVTTEATIDPAAQSDGQVVARAPGVIAGVGIIDLVFEEVCRVLGGDAHVSVTTRVTDGTLVARGDIVADITGSTQAILVGERTLLNVLSRTSGVATATRAWADALAAYDTTVLDTRKTTPGLRALEKFAVRAGGGTNKRMGLYDVAMIKDNHKLAAGSITAAYERIRERFADVPIQVEVTTLAEALEAVEVGARFVMCDNMPPDLLAETVAAVEATGEDVEIEATGGLTLERGGEYAATGVDYLSVGALTHSAPILDIALDLVDQEVIDAS